MALRNGNRQREFACMLANRASNQQVDHAFSFVCEDWGLVSRSCLRTTLRYHQNNTMLASEISKALAIG